MRKTAIMLSALAGVACFCASIAFAAPEDQAGVAGASESAAPVDGSWTEHSYSFVHLGFTSTYSCDALADKLKLLLRAAGARADLVATPRSCAGGFGRPSKLAGANLKFYTLKPAAMVSLSATPGAAPPPAVPGVWKPVQFADRVPRDLGRGDCELLEEFRDWLLPMFATRAVSDNLRCVPHQISGADLSLGFQSFVALAPPAPVARP